MVLRKLVSATEVFMSKISAASVTLLMLAIMTLWNFARPAPKPQEVQGEAARGRYLVEEVARCWFCHTPRNERGEADRSHWLQGGALWFTPVHHRSDWTQTVPAIAALGGFTEADVLGVLETGIGPNGHAVLSPMPAFHLAPADAKAIVAYLKTLPNPPH